VVGVVIKIIFFDAFGTLFHLQGSVGEHYAAIARRLGTELSPRALDDAFAWAWRNAPMRPANDHTRKDDDKPWWRDLLAAVLSQIPKISPRFDRENFFEIAYKHFAEPGVWTLYPEVRHVLELIAPRFQLAIISNFDRRLHTVLDHLKIASYFQGVFVSSELGADKPDPEIYRRALARSRSRASEAIHVGDDPERDWTAASHAGMHIFKLDRARNSLRDLLEDLAITPRSSR
jgi:putative hydrolase of the HAD superfamily